MTLAEWSSIGTIIGAVGTVAVGLAALFVSLATLRTQREALPVTAEFGLGKRIELDDNGVRWIWSWMKNTGTKSFVHDVSTHDWKPVDLPDEEAPNLARVELPDSLPPWLRLKSANELRQTAGIFAPGYLRTQAYSMFWISCPPGVEKVKFTAAMSVSKRDPVRFVSSEWVEIPQTSQPD